MLQREIQGDRQAMGILTDIIYDVLKSGEKIDLELPYRSMERK